MVADHCPHHTLESVLNQAGETIGVPLLTNSLEASETTARF